VTTETVPVATDANYHTYTIYEIDSNLVYQRDGITQKIIASNQPDADLQAVLQGAGEVDWIFVRKFSTQDYILLVSPVANFTATTTIGNAPLTVQFTDTSLHSPTSWAWTFGDGTTSTEQNPTHTFDAIGDYTVTLTVTNLRGSDTYTATVQAVALIAIPEFGANITKGVAPLTVQFTDQSENVTAWAWNFGDGQTSTDQHPVHTFSNIGNWTVTLTGTNLHGSNTTSMVIAATLPPPVANFTQNVTTGDEPLAVQFTDESTHSPDRWLWAFGDGQTSTEQHPVHTYVDGGSYQVSLTVSSFAGTDTLTVPAAVTVGHVYAEPVAAFSSPASVDKDTTIQFTDQSTNEPLSWSWTFGDGQTATTRSPSHRYTTPGTYEVSLTVTNPIGTNTMAKTVTVLEKMPVVAFAGTPTVGNHPMPVQFTDKTSNNPTSWSWNFGDGQTSTDQHPTHTYTAAGAYTVTLTVTNARGNDDEIKTDYIRVGVPDVAFTANVTDGNKPLAVQFTDESTNEPTAWLWTFGDGQTSTEQHPVHTYTTAGMKTVTLKATNANGAATLTRTNYITVVELRPVASFTAPVSIDRYQYAYFTDQSTNNPTKWEWSFGDGQTYTTSSHYYRNPSHRYMTPGTYTVTLKVTNAIGSDTTTRNVIVNEIPPNAAFTATTTIGNAPLTVQFTDQSSNDPTSWFWDFGDGTNGTVRNPSHTYTEPGTYSVTLTATNAAGSAAVTKTDLVAVNTPGVVMTCEPTVGEKPLTVQFTDESTNEPTAWLWKFGDGQTSTEQNPTHVYTNAGSYSVTLTATNEYGTTTKTFTHAVTAYEWTPVAAFTADVTSGDKPLTVQFTDLSTNTPTQWSWQFGDGQTSTDRNPVHTYTDTGTYTVTLTAKNPKGQHTVIKTNYVTVEELPPVTAFTVDHTYTIVGQDVQFTDQSQNNPTQWVWTFGDGTTSSLKNPRHTYTDPGTYTVTLRVTNEKGQSDLIKINYVTADIHVPIADFECNPVLGPSPLTVQFTDESEFLPYLWFWDFGDGTTSTVQHPTHTYTVPGTYTVVLRSSNAVGSDTITRPEIITVQLPDVNFTASPTLGGSPLTVKFTTDGSPDWSYHWSFGDGTTSNEQNPVHVYKTYQDQQFFTVSLTVAYGGEEQDIVKPNYIDVRTKSIETFMAEQQENITGVVAIGAVMATIAGIIVIYLGL
jgi:PKD repeat protein